MRLIRFGGRRAITVARRSDLDRSSSSTRTTVPTDRTNGAMMRRVDDMRCFTKDGHTYHAFASGSSLRCQCGDVALTDEPKRKNTEPPPLREPASKKMTETTRRLAYDPGDETRYIEEL